MSNSFPTLVVRTARALAMGVVCLLAFAMGYARLRGQQTVGDIAFGILLLIQAVGLGFFTVTTFRAPVPPRQFTRPTFGDDDLAFFIMRCVFTVVFGAVGVAIVLNPNGWRDLSTGLGLVLITIWQAFEIVLRLTAPKPPKKRYTLVDWPN